MTPSRDERPNVVIILADDLGYGDLGCYDQGSLIPTPHLDRLAASGTRFTNAHATSAVCTPSRYSLLTGRYNWRSRLKAGIVCKWDAPLIHENEPTIATVFARRGYRTSCIGKWHLGWEWPTFNGVGPNVSLPFSIDTEEVEQERVRFGYEQIDFGGRLGGGPTERGFDSYFGVDVPNYPPYAWIEDDHVVGVPSEPKPDHLYGDDGLAVPGWRHENMLPEFARRAEELIHSSHDEPFLLYLPLTAPHSPITPNAEFAGASTVSAYGDFVMEVDAFVGRIINSISEAGLSTNTIVVFASDNGPELRTSDDEGAYERARRTGHFSSGVLRGIKHDAWEGGHRVPLIVAWPSHFPSGIVTGELASLVDLFATLAEAADVKLCTGEAPDSISLVPLCHDREASVRKDVVVHSRSGKFGILSDGWAFIDAASGAETTEPEWIRALRGYGEDKEDGCLYDLDSDLSEARNLFALHPSRAAMLKSTLEHVKSQCSNEDASIDRELYYQPSSIWPGA